jgi:hypothetical protein
MSDYITSLNPETQGEFKVVKFDPPILNDLFHAMPEPETEREDGTFMVHEATFRPGREDNTTDAIAWFSDSFADDEEFNAYIINLAEHVGGIIVDKVVNQTIATRPSAEFQNRKDYSIADSNKRKSMKLARRLGIGSGGYNRTTRRTI